jgi:hypothetical protein
MSVAPVCAVAGRRLCALLAVCSAGLHLLMLGHTGSIAAAVVLLVMLGVCLFCAGELWRAGSVRAWTLVALMNLGMLALHLSGVGHQHGVAVTQAAVNPSALMRAVAAIAVVEVAAATAVLLYRTRGRAAQLSAGRGEVL